MIIVFVLGYTLIAFEHENDINKASLSLTMGVLMWAILAVDAQGILDLGESLSWNTYIANHVGEIKESVYINFVTQHGLLDHIADISSIIFFLLGAMTIVEVIDRYQGFLIITTKVKTTNRVKLLWIISLLTFFMSAALDNLTTTIIVLALLRKILDNEENRWFFAGMVIISANAGGAWSPIGDITTIMLWIGGQITAAHIITLLFLPSLMTVIVPLTIASFIMPGETVRPELDHVETKEYVAKTVRIAVLVFGTLALISVPFFKHYTNLPPFMGMLFSLGALWIITDRMLKLNDDLDQRLLSVRKVLRKVDISTVLFFLGILIAVSAFQTAGHLDILSLWLNENIGNLYGINLAIGLLSAVIDNVPLVAASMGMYPIVPAGEAVGFMSNFVVNGDFWSLLAFCAGTGGSVLIIGSAAGVAAMGMEKIDFVWYWKKISWLALIGYISGVLTYALIN